jgi:hypothetical protein
MVHTCVLFRKKIKLQLRYEMKVLTLVRVQDKSLNELAVGGQLR